MLFPSHDVEAPPPSYELVVHDRVPQAAPAAAAAAAAEHAHEPVQHKWDDAVPPPSPPPTTNADVLQAAAANDNGPEVRNVWDAEQDRWVPYNRHWNYERKRRSLAFREPRSAGLVWRILLFAAGMATIVYSALDPAAMRRNASLCLAVVAGAVVAGVQAYIVVTRFSRCLPYAVEVVVALDGLSVGLWAAAAVVLAYWQGGVLYRPRAGVDPREWLRACYDASKASYQYDSFNGGTSSVHIVWCNVRVDGHRRLIGNSAARLQQRTILALSFVCLFFNAIVLYISIRKRRNPYWCKTS